MIRSFFCVGKERLEKKDQNRSGTAGERVKRAPDSPASVPLALQRG